MAGATDVPFPFDLVISGNGYILATGILPSLPFRTQRGRYGYTPTFLTRQNVSGDFGDNQQDFWLTAAQRDWSLGEDQKFFKQADKERSRQYWLGSNINVTIPGQVTIERAASSLTFAAAVSEAGSYPAGSTLFTSTTTNLYEVNSAGTITDRGAHGAGGIVTAFATDGTFLYLSGSACTKIRKYDLSAHTYADFNATQQVDSLAFLNNTLYGISTGTLYNFDTGGNKADLFDFKTATGVVTTANNKITPFGGKLAILRSNQTAGGSELWVYDGVGVSKIAEYPPNFRADDFCVSSGIIFVIGIEGKVGEGFRTAIYYYANGTIGRAWANPTYTAGTTGKADIATFGEGVIFVDVVNSVIRFYDLSVGGVSSVAAFTPNANAASIAVANQYALVVQGTTTGTFLFSSAKANSGTIASSIIDFDSSLNKLFRGVIVDFVAGSDGNGGSVDISYQVDAIDGSYTSLQTSAVSGTEYNFSGNPTGRGISIKVTLNKGTSTLGPVFKRLYVRAAPRLTQFKSNEYVIDCTGRRKGGEVHTPVFMRNGLQHPKTGFEMAQDLITAATSTVPITIIDRFATFSGIIEPENFELLEVRPEEFYCRLTLRQV